jgi:hypothetical protein
MSAARRPLAIVSLEEVNPPAPAACERCAELEQQLERLRRAIQRESHHMDQRVIRNK